MTAPRTSSVSPHDAHDGADTVEGFARRNAISRAQAYKEIAGGRLIARKVGSRTIIARDDAAKWRRALPKASAPRAGRARSNGLPVWLTDQSPRNPQK
jgi:hypothetical protein